MEIDILGLTIGIEDFDMNNPSGIIAVSRDIRKLFPIQNFYFYVYKYDHKNVTISKDFSIEGKKLTYNLKERIDDVIDHFSIEEIDPITIRVSKVHEKVRVMQTSEDCPIIDGDIISERFPNVSTVKFNSKTGPIFIFTKLPKVSTVIISFDNEGHGRNKDEISGKITKSTFPNLENIVLYSNYPLDIIEHSLWKLSSNTNAKIEVNLKTKLILNDRITVNVS